MQSGNQGPELRNLLLAIMLSIAVLIGWQLLVAEPQRQAALESAKSQKESLAQEVETPSLPDGSPASHVAPSRSERINASPRVAIDSPSLKGSVNLRGLRIDDVTLRNYRQSVEEDSELVTLLSPSGGPNSYFAEFGWLARDENLTLPSSDTVWETQGQTLGNGQTLVARWQNEQGLQFERRITLDEDYLFTIEERVTNATQAPATLYPYGIISRNFADENKHFFILHEGPIGVFNEALEELTYEDLRDEGVVEFRQNKGWLGITDKYWLTALIPDRSHRFNAKMKFAQVDGTDRYQVDYTGAGLTLQPGDSQSVTHRLFAGAKEVAVLDRYTEQHQIPLFDRAVDFGMLYFMTKPIFKALDYFNGLLGNFGLAILALTVCIKLLLFPLANKSYKAMSQLKLLMPKIQDIRERYQNDKMAMNQEIMKLYQQEKVNPASGCLPILIQIPVFFALYKVLFVTIEMRHADFYGWVDDLSAPDPTSVFNLFGLIPWDPPSFLMIGAWPLIMCATMIIQQRLNPKPTDPTQAMVMQWLPFIFLFLFASFPAGLVIYWAWNNTLSVAQQWFIMKRHGAK